jgi:hypothetical protein
VDLIAYWNVVKRRRSIMVVGLCIAAALAVMSAVKPTASGFTWRTPPVYDATTTLFVTQPGFPWGRGTLDEYRKAEGDPTTSVPRFSEPDRFEYLASLNSKLAERDTIERAAGKKVGIEDPDYDAAPLIGADGRALPLFQITAYETTPEGAVALANAVSDALRARLAREQGNNRIAAEDRIVLQVVEAAQEAEVFQGVKMTRPIMLFLLGAILTLAVAFVVDNLRGGRQGPAARSGEREPEAALGIVRNEPEEEDEDVNEEPVAARGRWAAPS